MGIVKLQRELAKRQEKMDFMEEHVGTMVEEMKKKNKLLQNLMLKQDVGTLATTDMDDNKHALIRNVKDEKRASEHTGIMSSLYSSKANDSGMTMELSLEINKKLQAVLEDTLLKNNSEGKHQYFGERNCNYVDQSSYKKNDL